MLGLLLSVAELMRGNLPRIYAFRFLRDFLLIMPAICCNSHARTN